MSDSSVALVLELICMINHGALLSSLVLLKLLRAVESDFARLDHWHVVASCSAGTFRELLLAPIRELPRSRHVLCVLWWSALWHFGDVTRVPK